MTLKQNHPLQNLKKRHPPPKSVSISVSTRKKVQRHNFKCWQHKFDSCNFSFGHEEILQYFNSEKPRVPVEAFFFFLFVFSPFVLYRQLICDSVGSDKRLKLLFIQNGVSNRNTGAALLFTGTFFTCLRALGKYSSLQLTLKTIAQTTALRQKEVNYFRRWS